MDTLVKAGEANKQIRAVLAVSKSTICRWRKSLGVEIVEVEPGNYFYTVADLQIMLEFAKLRKNGLEYDRSVLEILESVIS